MSATQVILGLLTDRALLYNYNRQSYRHY